MNRDLHSRAKALLYQAVQRSPDSRIAFLDEQCDDPELRREVDSLLEFLDEDHDGSDTSEPASERIDKYRLIRRIGEGGMGVVWEAEQERPLRRRVALKVIRRELRGAEILARFEAERQTLAVMEHPNIATVFDAGTAEDGTPFFAMEYVDGESITDYCEHQELDLEARLRLLVAVCRGVDHAHQRGVVHRDIKPSNLLVTSIDGKPVPKVIDFGVAKAADLEEGGAVSRTDRWVGTPDYMSPEQAIGGSHLVDRRTDVYALGVVLYEILVGRRPYASPDEDAGFEEIRRQVVERTPTKPSERVTQSDDETASAGHDLAARLRGDLDRITLMALTRDPDERYSSCAELAEDIERYLSGIRPTARQGARSSASKRRLTLALTLAVGMGGIAALIGLLKDSDRTASSATYSAVTAEARTAYEQADELLRGGSPEQLEQAIGLFEEAVAIDSTFAAAYTGLAESKLLLARRGDLPMERADAEAGTALQKSLALEPELSETHAVLGLLHILIGDLDSAEIALRRSIELDEANAAAHLRLGDILAARKLRDEADASYRRALELDPLSPAVHHSAAGDLMNAGRYDEGLLAFQRWLRVSPDSSETYRRMALWARTYGHLDDAVRWARRAVELDPEAPLNVNELIMAHSGLGEFDEANRWMERAYHLAPNNHWTFTLKAFQLLERGELDAFEAFMQEQLSLEPLPAADPLPQIARVRLALAARSKVYQGDHRSAVALYERAIGRPYTGILETGFDLSVFIYLAFAYQQIGEVESAGEAFDTATRLIDSRQGWIWTHLILPDAVAALQVLDGRDTEAVETLAAALDDGWAVGYGVLRYSPLFANLRLRADYRQLVKRLEDRLDTMRTRLPAAEARSSG